MPASTAKNGGDSAGARLARARARLGLSVDEVADQLKLDPHTVVALEADDHGSIGATVFVRGFLRRYAVLVGEPAAEIEELYARHPHAEYQPDLAKTGMHRIEPAKFQPRVRPVPALAAALVLVLAGAAWWALRLRPAATSSPVPVPVAQPPAGAVATDEGTVPGGGTPSTAPYSGLNAGNGAVPGPAGGAASAPADAPAGAQDQAAPEAPRHRLRIAFAGDCWAEIYDARGMRLFFGFGHAGTAQERSGVPPFRMVLGNVEAVSIALDGTTVHLPPGAPGERARLLLAANGNVTERR
jgi:cytoskeleton protein RodZ